ncbi:MAG: hypothetical protein IJT70_06895 [Clostridia bacterium]|nr:hypothetical protein [Clostridia bacterium]
MKNGENSNDNRISRPRRIDIKVENEKAHNPYYYKVAGRYRLLKFISAGALILYLVVMLVTNRSQITYENLMYLMKDLDTDIEATGAHFSTVEYDESQKMSTAIYKNRLAIATTSSFTLFNTTGSVDRNYSHSMENPKVLTGEKYAMVYDVGGTSYAVYTTIAQVLATQTESQIQGAALSEEGNFALITRARENRYVVTFYNENFKRTSMIYKDKYVMDVALSEDGKRWALVSCTIDGTDVECEVMSGKVDSEESRTDTIADALPLEVSFFSDGSFAVVCDSAVAFYSEGGDPVKKIPIGDFGINGISFCGDRLMTVENLNLVGSRNRAVVYDPSGDTVSSYEVESKVSLSALAEGNMFFAFDGELTRVSPDGEVARCACDSSAAALVPYGDNVVVCAEHYAVSAFSDESGSAGDTENTPDPGTTGEETVNAEFTPTSP